MVPRREPVFVIVSGPPASGKSTLAPQVAASLGLPLIAKDTIKDALRSVLDVPDVDASRHLGRASVRAMLAVAAQSPFGAVIESNFYRSIAGAELDALPGRVIELFCRCSPMSLGTATAVGLAPGMPVTSTTTAPGTSSGTTKSPNRLPDPGRYSRSTRTHPSTFPLSSSSSRLIARPT